MSEIITCPCGAKVRLPEQTANRAFRCPQCKNGIALTLDAQVLASIPLKPGDAGASCPICQSAISAEEPVVTCPECDQIHHRECWAEIGGCGSYGCKQAPAPEKAPPASQPLTAWGDTKKCPVCGETIKSIAVKCRYCQSEFGTVDPISLGDIHRRHKRKESEKGVLTTVIVLFALSLLGCLAAPLLAIVNCAVLLPKRRQIAAASPTHLVLAYSAIGITVLYSVLILIVAVWSATQ
jgi:hypothetical protein